jgi:hypothetical protein
MTPTDVQAYLRSLDPNARIQPGLLSNPLAKTNWQSVGHGRLRPLLPDPGAACETPSLDHLEAAIASLLFHHHVNVLIINGGDGTIHHALNAAIRVVDQASALLPEGSAVPLPLFLFVNGGGMNMLARVFDSRGHPVRTLRRFLDKTRGARFGTLPKRAVPLLCVQTPTSRRYGYIFGSELVFNALTMYERFGQGYPGLARFLYEVAAGRLFHTALWYRYGHLLDAPSTPLTVDDSIFETYNSVVATTVPLQLVKGLVATVRRTASPGGMNVVAVLPTDKVEVIGKIPSLMVGAPTDGVVYRSDVKRLALYGPYTLDGERFDRHEEADPTAPLEVLGTRRVVWGVSL